MTSKSAYKVSTYRRSWPVPLYILCLVLLSNFPGCGAKGLDLKLKANTENYILLTPKKFVGEMDKALQGWRQVWKSGGTICNLPSLVERGLTDLLRNGGKIVLPTAAPLTPRFRHPWIKDFGNYELIFAAW